MFIKAIGCDVNLLFQRARDSARDGFRIILGVKTVLSKQDFFDFRK